MNSHARIVRAYRLGFIMDHGDMAQIELSEDGKRCVCDKCFGEYLEAEEKRLQAETDEINRQMKAEG